MTIADAKHAAFCACGTDIKGFLKHYAAALEQASTESDFKPLRDFYSADYSSNRGLWNFDQPEDLGGATLTRLLSVQPGRFDRNMVLADIEGYLQDIKHIDHVKCKINLIEADNPSANTLLRNLLGDPG